MRATAEDADTAELVGINARAVYARATAIAVATAGLAGMFLAIRSTFEPTSGPTQLIFAFEAVVIGGFGSLWGTLLGGIVLGVAQTVGAQIDPQKLMALVSTRPGAQFTPAGVLRVPLPAQQETAVVLEALGETLAALA